MRLSLLVILLVGVALVAGQVQVEDRRQRARARFLELASKARHGDRAAQEELQARRRNRTRQPTSVSESPSEIPQRPVFLDAQPIPIEQPEISRHRSPVRQNPAPTPVFRDSRPAPRPQPVRTVRTRGPVRRTRIRLSRPVAPVPTTFRPAIFPPSLAPVPVFSETDAPPVVQVDPVTELPVIDIFPTEPMTEEPLPVLEHTPAPTEVTHQFEVQPEQIFIQPQPQRPRPSVQRIQRPRPAIERRERPREVVRLPQEPKRSTFDFEPHRALNQGLEVSSRAEHIVSRMNAERTTEPPVETIRRYSYFDEQGNYIFGYEATDGSFKEEKRGLDCIVTGKYGYVDPDGIRREFSYTSGNQCDPNAVVGENQEVVPLPLNNQFLQQTVEQQLTEEELNQINFNRHRQPVSKKPVPQTFISSSRRQRPQTRLPVQTRQRQPQPEQRRQQQPQPEQRRQQQPQLEQHQPNQPQPQLEQHQPQPEQHQQQPQPEQFQHRFSPIPVTPAPFPLFTFTTPSSFNRFTTPTSLRRPPQLKKRPHPQQPEQGQVQVVRTTTPPPVVARPTQPQVLPRPTPPPRPQPKLQPKPVAFDFNQEFQNIFSHFTIPTTRRPFFRAPIQAFRPTPASTRPPPPPSPTPQPTPPPPPPTPVTSAPAPSQPPRNEGSTSFGAPQLVFDARTGSFKTVRNPVRPGTFNPVRPGTFNPVRPGTFNPVRPGTFNPQPVQNPFVTPAPQAPVGRPLPRVVSPTGPSPLPRVPLGGLVISSPGRSPSTDEFDKFFSQFNLQF